jgi:iron complex outermembrane receptor protein
LSKKHVSQAKMTTSVSVAAILSVFGSAPAFAQDDGGLEEIVVTAQRKSESLQDTPISIVAFSSTSLENKGITGLSDLQTQVPNLQLTPFPNNATSPRVYIRGIGNNSDHHTQDPSVAVYVDGVYMARSQGLATEVADLERIEVLRGPQGSLYGRNATGGAINFITSAPELGEWGFKQNLTIGNLNHFKSRTMLNVPVGDKLAAQFSYMRSKRDGITENLGTGVKRFGDQDRTAYRAALRWQPTDNLDLRYTYDRTEIDDTPAHAASVEFYPVQTSRPKQGSPLVRNLRANDIISQGHAFTATLDLSDNAQLKSITAYRKLSSFTNQNFLPGVFGNFAAAELSFDQHQNQFSQELQLVGQAGDRLDYAVGLYYFTEQSDGFDTSFQLGFRQIDRWISAKNKAYAAYAQATYAPPIADDRLHLTVGARWSRDERKATYERDVYQSGSLATSTPETVGERNFNDFSPSATIAFDFTKDVNSYFRVATGYKTGGYNIGASSPQRFSEGFAPENVISYEWGIKSDLLDRKLRINAALFHMDYKDIQVNVPDAVQVSVLDVINAGKARIRGLELDMQMRPTQSLTFGFNYGYLDAKYREILNADGGDITNDFVYITAPKHVVSTSGEFRFPRTSIGEFSVIVDYNFQDKHYVQPNDRRYITGDYGLLNARLNLAEIPVPVGDLRLSLWGKNLTGKDYYISHGNLFAPGALFGEPRTYGIDLNFAF